MKSAQSYEPKDIRNVAFMGHAQSGKTALADAIFFNTGATTRLGKTQDQTSLFDVEPEEIHRGGSITSHFGWVEHDGRKINIIDTPGDQNFYLDGMTSVAGADAVLIVISAADGVQVLTRKSWKVAEEKQLPRFILLNKMDRATQGWEGLVSTVSSELGCDPVPLQVPMGSGESFTGVIDLLTQKALTWSPDGSGKVSTGEIPEEHKVAAEDARAKMIESIVSTNDELLEKYLNDGEIDEETLSSVFAKAIAEGNLVPLFFSSATTNVGIQPLLDFLAQKAPSPLDRKEISCLSKTGEEEKCSPNPKDPFLAQVIGTKFDEHAGQVSILRVFSGEAGENGQIVDPKTEDAVRLGTTYLIRGKERVPVDAVACGDIVAALKLKSARTNSSLTDARKIRLMPVPTYPPPMISLALIPGDKKDEDKLKNALEQMKHEDPTLATSIDDMSHRLVLSGMGLGHLDNVIERMRRRFSVNLTTELPSIPYREAFAKPVKNVEGKHKKQTGGAGQFGVCYIDVEPLPRGEGFKFVNKIFGGAIPRQYIPSVEKGINERARKGILIGFPVVDFQVTLIDGKHHPVDSKDIAFQMAGTKALKSAMESSKMVLLEPFYKMEIVVPPESAGDIMGDLNTRRGQIGGMDQVGDSTVVRATCPLAEIQKYVADLRSMTQGKGTFTLEFDSYKEVPDHHVEKLRKAQKNEGTEESEED